MVPAMLDEFFLSVSDSVGLPVDQVRYIILLFASYPLALILRHGLHPSHTSLAIRHAFSLTTGMAVGIVCFGWQMLYIAGIMGGSYLLLLYLPTRAVHMYTMMWAMGCLTICHTYRMITDYGGYHLDFTGPLMILVQKLTLVAFALHDGSKDRESLSKDQREQRISAVPSVLEFSSYCINFHSFLAGPPTSLQDYRDFIDGSNMTTGTTHSSSAAGSKKTKEPSAVFPVLYKLGLALAAMTVYIVFKNYPIDLLLDPNSHSSIPSLLLLTLVVSFRARNGFYFVWNLAESINNCAGLGFRGHSADGQPLWDLISVADPFEVELSTSMRSFVNAWNKPTVMWVRRVCYTRVRSNAVLASFVLSAMWHGLYPAYFLSFVYLALGIEASRKMRQWLRQYFQTNRTAAITYDIITLVTTHIFMGFGVPPFQMFWFSDVLLYWSYYYYLPVVSILLVVFFMPSAKKSSKQTSRDHSTRASSSDEATITTSSHSTGGSSGDDGITDKHKLE